MCSSDLGRYAFALGEVVGEGTKLFATVKNKKEGIQHSSFLAGHAVKSAGMLEIDGEGKIVGVSKESGHYKPTDKEMAHLIKYLKENEFDISKLTVLCTRHHLFFQISNTFNLNIKWMATEQSAENWYENIGSRLL